MACTGIKEQGMTPFFRTALSLGLLLGATCAANAASVDDFIREESFIEIKISPTGEYFAATVPQENRTTLAILRRSDMKLSGAFHLGANTHVHDFDWVNPKRLLISTAQKMGAHEAPRLDGNLYAMNADGSNSELLVGQSLYIESTGTHIQSAKKMEPVAAFLIDDLPADDKNVLISVEPFSKDPYTRVERLDVYTGRRTQVARSPVRNSSFVADNRGVVRFAIGKGVDYRTKVFYRPDDKSEWQLMSGEGSDGLRELPLGFSADDSVVYLRVEQASGPDTIMSWDVASGERKPLLRDDNVDPYSVIYRNASKIPLGITFMDGKPRTEFFDAQAPEARLMRGLEEAFPDAAVRITSQTQDGKTALVSVRSDRNPGDFYLMDVATRKVTYAASRREWLDPEKMGPVRPVALKARDGLPLHGYLTLPAGSDGKKAPLVVMPHGGPYFMQDVWGFDLDAQILASAGYAVLQLNFRGSDGYGVAFSRAGAQQWGKAMQDDLTDATHWAVAQGIADGNRICMYGGSYGGYSSLMGVVREPDLYRCTVGYVGVYDLPKHYTMGDIRESQSGRAFLKEWVGDPAQLAAVSPNLQADRIKVPVFLAAGGEDERTPSRHTKLMEQALIKAGKPVETLYFASEGHGFYKREHRKEFYTRLVGFLDRHIGKTATAASAAAAGSTPAPDTAVLPAAPSAPAAQ